MIEITITIISTIIIIIIIIIIVIEIVIVIISTHGSFPMASLLRPRLVDAVVVSPRLQNT